MTRVHAQFQALTELLAENRRRVIVLDDDPTGTQTSSAAGVILVPDRAALAKWFGRGDRGVFVLTNTRSMPERDATALLRRIRRDALDIAAERGESVAFVLRGDSTLRGHVFPEIDVFAEPGSATLLVPAFPEGGRHTLAGVHYLTVDGILRPVHETEFAADPVFGFGTGRLADWVRERSGRAVVGVPIDELHRRGPDAVAEALLTAPDGAVVAPDAVSVADVATIGAGLLQAEAAGRVVVTRAAATLASLLLGVRPRPLDDVPLDGPRLLVVCGSHTMASTAQLLELERITGPPRLLPVDLAMGAGPAAAVGEFRDTVLDDLDSTGHAVLATERRRRPEYDGLAHGATMMRALVAVVAAVRQHVDGVIVKGGISSAEVAVNGFGARYAEVEGQLLPGVSLWRLRTADGRGLPYAVVPGNVGGPDTLVRVVRAFRRAM
jgi:uncharacterized protein YgbK (DUF1537 family)